MTPVPADSGHPRNGSTRWTSIVLVVALTLYSILVWESFGSLASFQFLPHIDMTASFVIARDCAEGRGCTLEIIPNGGPSILGFGAGAIANHLAAIVYAATGDFRGTAVLCEVFLALASGLVFLAADRRVGALGGLVAYVLFLRMPEVGKLSSFHQGLYSSHQCVVLYHFIPLFSACAVLFGMEYTRHRRPRFLYLTALAVSLAAQTHQTGLALLPSLAYAALQGTSGWWRLWRAAAAACVFVASYALLSFGVLYHFHYDRVAGALATLNQQSALLFPLLGITAVAALVFGFVVRHRQTAPHWFSSAPDMVYVLLAALPASPIFLDASINRRYVYPMTPALAVLGGILIGAAVRALFSWLIAALNGRGAFPAWLRSTAAWQPLSLLLLVGAWQFTPFGDGPPMLPPVVEGTSALAGSAKGPATIRTARGLGVYDLKPALSDLAATLHVPYNVAFARIRAPMGFQEGVLGTAAMVWPLTAANAPEPADRNGTVSALVLATPPGFALPARFSDWTFYPTTARFDVAVHRFQPYVRPDCIAWKAAEGAANDWHKTAFLPANFPLTDSTFKWRLMPQVDGFARPSDIPQSAHGLLLRFALHVPKGGPPHTLLLPPSASPDLAVTLERIEGVSYRGNLPGSVVLVGEEPVESEGFVEIKATTREPHRSIKEQFLPFPPSLLEIDPEVYPLIASSLDIAAPGLDHGEITVPAPLPALPDRTAPAQFHELRSLQSVRGQAMSIDEFFTPDPNPVPFLPSDPTVPFWFIVAMMSLYALLLTAGTVRILLD